MARKEQKTVLVFMAAQNIGLPADQHTGKLAAFRTLAAEGQLTPREFTSPDHLALQVAQSFSYRYIKAGRVAEKLAYLCDRVPHSSRFSMDEQKLSCPFKQVLLWGRTEELCGNFINRIGLLHLSLEERRLVAPVLFDDFLYAESYAENLQLLLYQVYQKRGLPESSGPLSIAALLKDAQQRQDTLAIVINADAAMFEDAQMDFLKAFVRDCYETSCSLQSGPFYVFFYLEEDRDAAPGLAEEKIDALLQRLPDAEAYTIKLPRLSAINRAQIKQWLRKEVTPDDGTAEEMMDAFFGDLPKTGFSMKQAHKHIAGFINAMNSGSPQAAAFINLY